MKTVELQVPRVTDDAGNVIGYGGSQDWFPDGWKRMSGCGPTAGANAAAVLAMNRPETGALTEGFLSMPGSGGESCGGESCGSASDAGAPGSDVSGVTRGDYVGLMLEMFSRMTPKMMGYPYAGKWGRAFRTYAAERGVRVGADVYDHWTDWREAFGFIREHIDDGVPVPMLVLYHRAPEMQDEIWHWILVTGYTEPEELGGHAETAQTAASEDDSSFPQVIVSDYADRDLYRADIMLEAHPRNLVKMVDLSIE